MPLPSAISWRVVQVVSVVWCVFLSVSMALCGYWTVYDRKSLLLMFLNVSVTDSKFKKSHENDVNFIWMVLYGSLAVTIGAIISGFMTSCAITAEKRWMMIAFGLFNTALFVLGISFGGLAFYSKGKAVFLTEEILQYGIKRYATLQTPGDQWAPWRFAVDQIQMQGGCCGFTSHTEYKPVFIPIFYSEKNHTACVCRGDDRRDCRAQHIPFSCCKRQKSNAVNPLCATNIFKEPIQSTTCNSVNANESVNNDAHMAGCKLKIPSMNHITFLLWHGIVNAVIAFMTFVLTAMLAVLAWKTSSRKEFIQEEIQSAFKVDSRKAAKMLDEAKDPSMSFQSIESSRNRSFNADGSFRDGPQRVSSDRLEPRPPDSFRQSISESRRPTTRAPMPSGRRPQSPHVRQQPSGRRPDVQASPRRK